MLTHSLPPPHLLHRLKPFTAFFLPLIFASGLTAHPISLSAAVIDVHKDKVRVEITIMLEDLVLYHRLRANDKQLFSATDLHAAQKRHRNFLLKYFQLRGQAGKTLAGKVVNVRDKGIDKAGVLQSQLMTKSVDYVLEYRLARPIRFLTVVQNFGGAEAALPALMDCMILQGRCATSNKRQLISGKPMSFEVDWKNPPKAGRNWREVRAQRAADRRKRLGITSFSGLYSFIYVTDSEIRHEVLIPLPTFEKWLPLPRQKPDLLSVKEQVAARKKIAAFFRDQAPVQIDGRLIRPRLQRLNFFGLDIRDFALNAKPRPMSIYQARLGAILSYPLKQPARTLAVRWKLFNEHATFLESAILVDDQKPRRHTFVKSKPTFAWQAKAPRPGISIKPVKRQANVRLSDKRSERIALELLQNVYAAFQFREESQTYDALASSIEGALLRDIYLQVPSRPDHGRTGRSPGTCYESRNEGARLQAGANDRRFQLDCRWEVQGQVEHWGHLHQRKNEYRAKLTVEAAGAHWKLSGYDVRNVRRLQSQTTLRQ